MEFSPVQTAAIAALLVAILLVAALWFRRRRLAEEVAGDAEQDDEETEPEGIALPVQDNVPETLHIEASAQRLAVGMRNVTLDYRLTLHNRGPGHLVGLRIAVDIAAATAGDRSGSEILNGPDMKLAAFQTIARIDPGECSDVSGQVMMPLDLEGIDPSGKFVLLLPLLRLRVVGAGTPPRRFAFVIGLPPDGPSSKLRPIRLDQGPKIYSALAAKLVE